MLSAVWNETISKVGLQTYFILFSSDKFLTHGIINNNACYTAIRLAVAKSLISGSEVKKKLGDELIGLLDQVFKLYYQECGKNLFNYYLGRIYKYLHMLLGFPVDDISTLLVSAVSSDEPSDEE